MKIAYLLGRGPVTYRGRSTGRVYVFDPWNNDVSDEDWPQMQTRRVIRGGCCNKPARQMRVFGSEEEVRTGQVEAHWR